MTDTDERVVTRAVLEGIAAHAYLFSLQRFAQCSRECLHIAQKNTKEIRAHDITEIAETFGILPRLRRNEPGVPYNACLKTTRAFFVDVVDVVWFNTLAVELSAFTIRAHTLHFKTTGETIRTKMIARVLWLQYPATPHEVLLRASESAAPAEAIVIHRPLADIDAYERVAQSAHCRVVIQRTPEGSIMLRPDGSRAFLTPHEVNAMLRVTDPVTFETILEQPWSVHDIIDALLRISNRYVYGGEDGALEEARSFSHRLPGTLANAGTLTAAVLNASASKRDPIDRLCAITQALVRGGVHSPSGEQAPL